MSKNTADFVFLYDIYSILKVILSCEWTCDSDLNSCEGDNI